MISSRHQPVSNLSNVKTTTSLIHDCLRAGSAAFAARLSEQQQQANRHGADEFVARKVNFGF
jgi:hypothetical protein